MKISPIKRAFLFIAIFDVTADVTRFSESVSTHRDRLGPDHAVASVELWQLDGSEPPF